MKIEAYGAGNVGMKRDNNEDQFLVDPALGVYMVCDGMGGHAAGEVASDKAVSVVRGYLVEHKSILEKAAQTPDGYYRVLELAEKATQHASRELYHLACSNNKYAGMGTTLTLLLVVDNKAIMAHVGDSRLYLLRDKRLHQLSTDHTLAQELVAAGALPAHELHTSRQSHILTRAVGTHEGVQVETLLFDLFANDTFLLCSDGLSNYFHDTDDTIRLLVNNPLADVPTAFVQYANKLGGRDNITAVVVHVTSDAPRQPDRRQQALQRLRKVKLFRKLSLNRLARLLNASTIQTFKPNTTVLSNGDAVDGLYLLMSGTLKLVYNGENEQTLHAGETFGEAALLYAHSSDASLIAAESSDVLFLGRRSFDRLAHRWPRLGYLVARRIGEQLAAIG